MHVDEDDRVTDEELAALAVAAAPEGDEAADHVGDDAVSLWDVLGAEGGALLPEWYMPAPMGTTVPSRRWWRWVVWLLVASFLAINAYGLCSTYGSVGFG